MLHLSVYVEELRKKQKTKQNSLRVLLNIPWHSSSLCDPIFFHKGSRRTSASERILAELGTFQGPGLMGPFGLCTAPGILFTEATEHSLLLSSLELENVSSLPFPSLGETTEPFLLHISLKADSESLLTPSLLAFRSSAGLLLTLASFCPESRPVPFSFSLSRGGVRWCRVSPTLLLKLSCLCPDIVLSPLPSVSFPCVHLLISGFAPLQFFVS